VNDLGPLCGGGAKGGRGKIWSNRSPLRGLKSWGNIKN